MTPGGRPRWWRIGPLGGPDLSVADSLRTEVSQAAADVERAMQRIEGVLVVYRVGDVMVEELREAQLYGRMMVSFCDTWLRRHPRR